MAGYAGGQGGRPVFARAEALLRRGRRHLERQGVALHAGPQRTPRGQGVAEGLRDCSGRHRANLDIAVVLGGQAHRPVPVRREVVVEEADVVATPAVERGREVRVVGEWAGALRVEHLLDGAQFAEHGDVARHRVPVLLVARAFRGRNHGDRDALMVLGRRVRVGYRAVEPRLCERNVLDRQEHDGAAGVERLGVCGRAGVRQVARDEADLAVEPRLDVRGV